MGGWQIFLTIYLILQMIAGIIRQTYISKLKGESDSAMKGSLVGICTKFIIMFVALYMGGFYNT